MSLKNKFTPIRLEPDEVLGVLRKHMLADGFEFVLDLEKSNRIRLVDARTCVNFLDLFSFFGSLPVSFNHPKMKTPEFTKKLLRSALYKPSCSDIYTVEMAEFVATMSSIVIPAELPNLFLIEGGAPAVSNAFKAAFDWKVRKNLQKGYKEEKGSKIIHFEKAFHGRTGYTMSATNTADPKKYKYFPKFKWPRIPSPYIDFPLTDKKLNDLLKKEDQAIELIKKAFYENKDDIAAIVIEPIQAEGGDNHFRGEFLHSLRTLASENDAMLIFDEVQTGMGLTGKMWAFEHYPSLSPDILVFGKKFQVCGILCSNRIHEVDNNVFREGSRINSTFGGNLCDMVRATRFLEIIEEDNLLENARILGDYLVKRLLEFQDMYPDKIFHARGRGLMAAFDLKDAEIRDLFFKKLFDNRIIMLKCGVKSMRFRPVLDIKKEELDECLDIIEKVIQNI